MRPTAAILVIGNEMLTGKVHESNAHYLAGELFRLGVELRRILTVPDEPAEIVEALRDLRSRVDLVFTSGGIGPTHDDVTMAAVCEALGRSLVRDPELEARVHAFFGDDLGPQHLRMAMIPQGCELVESERMRWPTIVVDRVFVLAGVPELFRRGLEAARHLIPRGAPSRLISVFVKTDEWTLAPLLDSTVAAFPSVLIGSYPVLRNPSYRVKVTLEGPEPAAVAAARDCLIAALPDGVLVRVEEDEPPPTCSG